MLANYTFSKYKDIYSLGNSDNTSLSYSLAKQINCGDYSQIISSGTISAQSSLIIPIILDGDYQITITRNNDTIILDIKNLLSLQKGLLFNLRQLICGYSSCKDCEIQGLDDCVGYQGVFGQIIGYQYFIKNYSDIGTYCSHGNILDAYLHQAIQASKCVISDELYSQLIQESSGKISGAKHLMRDLAIIYYTGFYLYERLLANDDEKAFVDAKYYWGQVQVCIKSQCIDLNSLRAVFSNIVISNNVAPTVGNVSKTFNFDTHQQYTYNFIASDFTNNFQDENGDQPNQVMILLNPLSGRLYYNNTLISNAEGYIFNIANVNNLSYKYTPTIANPNFDIILFKINDTNPTPIYSNMATITIAVAGYINMPPDHVGNNSIALTNRVNRVFTMADFTTSTTPPYHDPEGDGVYQLRIDSLPSVGILKVNGAAATSGQIIAASVITGGNFEYDAPDQNSAATVTFNFSLSDTGSHQFTS